MPRLFVAQASGGVAAGSTNTDIPSVSIAITTLANNVVWAATGVVEFDGTTGTTTITTSRLLLNNVEQSGQVRAQSASASGTFLGTFPQVWGGTLATAGVYTFKMQATTPSGMAVNATHSKLLLQTIGHVSY